MMTYNGIAVIYPDKKVQAKDLKSGDIVFIRDEFWFCLCTTHNGVVIYKKVGRSDHDNELRSTLEAPMILCKIIAMPKEGMLIDVVYPARKTSQETASEPFKKRMRVELVAVNKFWACNEQDGTRSVFQLRAEGLYDVTNGLLYDIRVTYEPVETQ